MINGVLTAIANVAIIIDAILSYRRGWTGRRAYAMTIVGVGYALAAVGLALFHEITPLTASFAWLPAAIGISGLVRVLRRSRDASQLLAERVMADHVSRELARENRGNVRVVKGPPLRTGKRN